MYLYPHCAAEARQRSEVLRFRFQALGNTEPDPLLVQLGSLAQSSAFGTLRPWGARLPGPAALRVPEDGCAAVPSARERPLEMRFRFKCVV